MKRGEPSIPGMFASFLKLDSLSLFSFLLILTMIIIIAVRVPLQVYYQNQLLQNQAQKSLLKTSIDVYSDPFAAATPENRLPAGKVSRAELERTYVNAGGQIVSSNRLIDNIGVYVSDSMGSSAISDNATFTQTWDFLGGNPAAQRVQALLNLGDTNTSGTNINCRLVATSRGKPPLISNIPDVIDPATIQESDRWKYTIREVCEVSNNPVYTISDWLSTPSSADIASAIGSAVNIVVPGLIVKKLFF